jgi:hypothetical protein
VRSATRWSGRVRRDEAQPHPDLVRACSAEPRHGATKQAAIRSLPSATIDLSADTRSVSTERRSAATGDQTLGAPRVPVHVGLGSIAIRAGYQGEGGRNAKRLLVISWDHDVTRFATPAHLSSWAGLTPKHRESDTVVHRGPITKQGSALVRWAAVEAAQGARNADWLTETRTRIADRRGRNIATVAVARKLLTFVYYGLRDGHIRALDQTKAA